MESLFPFFIVFAAGLAFSESFKRLHLPYVTALILAGVLIGPVLNLVTEDPVLAFLSSIGVIFLMFIGGTEVKLDSLKSLEKDILFVVILNSVIPFGVGFCLGWLATGVFVESIILGIVFISSSIAVIIPSLEVSGMIETKVGRTIVTSCVFEDLGSLLLLSLVLQTFGGRDSLFGESFLEIPLYLSIVVILIVALKIFLPKIQELYYFDKTGEDLFESKGRFVFLDLIATVVIFEGLGMHAIIAGFIIGIIVGDSITDKVEHKIRTISYGIFIPIFFLYTGIDINRSFLTSEHALMLTFFIISGLFVSKVVSGWLAGKLLKFSSRESWLIGFSTTPQLSATIAAAVVATEAHLLSTELKTALIFLAIATTFIAPLMIKLISPGKEEKKALGASRKSPGKSL